MLTDDDTLGLFSNSLGFVQLRAQAQRDTARRARNVQFHEAAL